MTRPLTQDELRVLRKVRDEDSLFAEERELIGDLITNGWIVARREGSLYQRFTNALRTKFRLTVSARQVLATRKDEQ